MRLNTDRPDMLMRFRPGRHGLIKSVPLLHSFALFLITRYEKPRRLQGDICPEMGSFEGVV